MRTPVAIPTILVALIAALIFAPAPASSAPCVTNPTTLLTFLGGPGGAPDPCSYTVGSLTFTGADNLSFIGSGTFSPATPDSINVAPQTLFGLPGLRFSGGLFVGANSSLNIDFDYLAESSGALITDVHLTFNGSFYGTGFAEVIETVRDAVTGEVLGQADVTVGGGSPSVWNTVIDLSRPAAAVLITKDILLVGGPQGRASISFVDQLLSQAVVPEPASLLVLGGGIVAVALAARRVRRA